MEFTLALLDKYPSVANGLHDVYFIDPEIIENSDESRLKDSPIAGLLSQMRASENGNQLLNKIRKLKFGDDEKKIDDLSRFLFRK